MKNDRFLNSIAALSLLHAGVVALMLIAEPAQAVTVAKPAAQTPAAGVFSALDSNQDQTLSLQEFQAGYAVLQRSFALEIRMRDQFRAVDADHNGAIEVGEYAELALVKRAGNAAPALSAFDTNQDQKLGFDEYLAVVRKLAAPQPTSVPEKKP